MLLFARLSLAPNLLLNTAFIVILTYFCITFYTRLSTIFPAFSRNWRDLICLEFIIGQYMTIESRIYFVSIWVLLLSYPAPACTKCSSTESFKSSSHAICLILIDNRERLIRLSFQWFHELVVSLLPCNKLFPHSQLSGLLQQITLYLFHILVHRSRLSIWWLTGCVPFFSFYILLINIVSLCTTIHFVNVVDI